jgi:hypothetical protein
MSAEARVASISEILNEGLLTVPVYQRPYSWGKDEVEVFLDDLDLLSKHEQHLFGMIVLTPSTNSTTSNAIFDVIDGQQRLTTCLLTLAICHDKLKDLSFSEELNSDSDLKEELQGIKSELNGLLWSRSEKRQRLLTENESVLEQRILKCFLTDPSKLKSDEFEKKDELVRKYDESPSSEKSTSVLKHDLVKEFDQRTVRHLKMVKNHKLISEHLDNEILRGRDQLKTKIKAVEQFSDKVRKQLTSVRFKVDSEYNAFKLFETMNDRGLGISAMDLIKNLGLRNLSEDDEGKTQFIKTWKEIFEDTLEGSHLTFLRYSVNFRSQFIKKSEIYGVFKERVFDSASHVKAEIKSLKRYAGYFQDCWYTKKWPSDKPFYQELALLQSTKTQQWIVVAMSLMHLRKQVGSKDYDAEIKKIYRLIYTLIFTQLIRDLGSNQFEKLFPELAFKIYQSLSDNSKISSSLEDVLGQLRTKLNEIQPLSGDELKEKVIEKNDVARMTCYAVLLSHLNHGHDPSMTLTLEHVYPQNPEEGTWAKFTELGEEGRRQVTYSLGNFILLEDKLNASVGRKDFTGEHGKKASYNKQKVHDHLVPIHEQQLQNQISRGDHKEMPDFRIRHLQDFTPTTIEKRAEAIAAELERLLSVYGSGT